MKATVMKSEWVLAVETICRVVENKSSLPVLASVMVTAEKDGVTLRATDLDMEVTVFVAAKVVEPGSVLMQAKTILGVSKALDDDDIEIATLPKGKVKMGPASFQTVAQPDDFPKEMPGVETRETTGGFVRGLRAVAFAASTDDTRFLMNGVFYDHASEEKPLVATDGHRLAHIRAPDMLVSGGSKGQSIIVPTKAVHVILEMEKRYAKRIPNVGFSTKALKKGESGSFTGEFRIGPAKLVFRCIDGQFPEYQRVIPREDRDEYVVRVARKTMEKALKLALTMAPTSKGMKACVNGVFRIDTNDFDVGEVSQEVDAVIAKKKDGAVEATFGVNITYLLDGCKFLPPSDGDEILIGVDDEHAPLRLTAGGMTYIVMPMRL